MKKLISALWLVSSLTAGAAWAQPYAPNEAGVTNGHWHLNSGNLEANKKIFMGMGGVAGEPGPLQRVISPASWSFSIRRQARRRRSAAPSDRW